jgi:hypothetical protein
MPILGDKEMRLVASSTGRFSIPERFIPAV